eukprot:CAMPEP_0204268782 /NCGR_PEP_ID=MMETSP0468-20130131/14463_1 /ASSEMBLY_ACC=CAM_ASM_000383 /TAXON_ID=2969 /ORGANISM="Oxyrrhis marina" /LENGTH=135 /DNA_ID=CAMNT_0051244091 /DNA_START=63 /DNA_END=470 /DNA_ORIENTATION=-
MAGPPPSVMMGNQEVMLWRWSQLTCLSSDALRKRAANLRDQCPGLSDQVGAVPRHPDDVANWILNAQSRLIGCSPSEFGCPTDPAGAPAPMPVRADVDRCSEAASEVTSDYNFLQRQARDNATRNRGSSNLLSWD